MKGLKLLLNAADDKIIDIDKVIESKTDVSWLLTNLPQLPNFHAFKSQVSDIFFVLRFKKQIFKIYTDKIEINV